MNDRAQKMVFPIRSAIIMMAIVVLYVMVQMVGSL